MKVSQALEAQAQNIEVDLETNRGSYTASERQAMEKAASLIRDLAATWSERREIYA